MLEAKYQPGDRVSVFVAEVMGEAPAVVVGFKEDHKRWGRLYEVVDVYGDVKTIAERGILPRLSRPTWGNGNRSTRETYQELARRVAEIVNGRK